MNTQNKTLESKLSNRIADTTRSSEGQRKWLLYVANSPEPLLGSIHGASRAEALDRVSVFRLPVIAVAADAPRIDSDEMTPERIARHFELLGSIIPAQSDDPGRRRTTYFYRQQAIAWGRMARQWWPSSSFMKPICLRLAKRYLALYRFAKTMAS